MSDIVKVHRERKLNIWGFPARMIIPLWITGSLGSVAVFFEAWPAIPALVALVAGVTYKYGLNVDTDDILNPAYKTYYQGISEAGATKDVVPRTVRNSHSYYEMFQKEPKAPVRKALNSVKPRELSNAVMFGKTLSMPVHTVSVGDMGGTVDYNLVIKGKNISMTSVRHTSDMELWNRARTAAANIR